MRQAWSATWNASKQPRKQRKYRYNAGLHTKQKFLSVHLSKELQKKYGRKSATVRTGDKIKILVGDNKGKEAKVSRVDLKNVKVFIEGVERIKIDGSKTQIAFEPSNLIILTISKEDRGLKKKTSSKPIKKEVKETPKKKVKQPEVKKETKEAPKKEIKKEEPKKVEQVKPTEEKKNEGTQ
jgi:large subunit ribosomal protein L24